MKILYIGKYYHPYKGGIETVSRSMARSMVKLGHEVTILVASNLLRSKEEIIEGVRVVRLSTIGKLFSQPLVLSLFWKYIKYAKRADIVHLHTPNPLVELFALLFIWTKPIFITYHSDIINQKKLLVLYAPFLKLLLKKVTRVQVSSRQLLNNSNFLSYIKEKVEVVPFGIEPNHMKFNSQVEKLAMINKQTFGKYLLFVGRLVPYKGLDILLEALKETSNNLIIIGEGPEKQRINFLVKKNKLEDRVTLLDHVDDEDLFAAYFYGANAFVLPSVNDAETFGIVLMEALSCGLPCVSTKLNTGVRDVNIHDKTGLEVTPLSVDELASGINKLFSSNEYRDKLSKGAKSHFQENFTEEIMMMRIARFYEQTLL